MSQPSYRKEMVRLLMEPGNRCGSKHLFRRSLAQPIGICNMIRLRTFLYFSQRFQSLNVTTNVVRMGNAMNLLDRMAAYFNAHTQKHTDTRWWCAIDNRNVVPCRLVWRIYCGQVYNMVVRVPMKYMYGSLSLENMHRPLECGCLPNRYHCTWQWVGPICLISPLVSIGRCQFNCN